VGAQEQSDAPSMGTTQSTSSGSMDRKKSFLSSTPGKSSLKQSYARIPFFKYIFGGIFRYQIKTVNTTNGISSELTLVNIGREDASQPFFCTAKNLCSSSCKTEQQEMWLIVLGKFTITSTRMVRVLLRNKKKNW